MKHKDEILEKDQGYTQIWQPKWPEKFEWKRMQPNQGYAQIWQPKWSEKGVGQNIGTANQLAKSL
jgi:hypothetical protein